ncbi:MAG: hypothetical protein AB7C98_06470 [Acidithiobacillus sp.]
MSENRSAPKRDWRRGWLGPFVVFVLLVLVTLWWLGVFNSPRIIEETGVAHPYVYQNFQGTYRDMLRVREKLFKRAPLPLQDQRRITVLEKEVGRGSESQVTARLGYMVSPGMPAPSGWSSGEWPAQQVVKVTVLANPAIASWKAYGALSDWGKARGISLHYPVFELLGPGNHYALWMPLSTALSAS